MTAAGLSVFVFGIYVIITGFPFLIMPNVALPMFRFEKTKEVWIRVLGLILVILGCYYITAGLTNYTLFYWVTVFGRAAVFVGFTSFVIAGFVKPMLLVFGIVDLLAAVWTLLALLLA